MWRNKRVLIVDDEQSIRELLERFFGLSFTVSSAENGLKAIEELEKNPYDLMLLDIMMPGIDGQEVLKRIKGKYPNMKVVIMTGYSLKDKITQCLQEGAATCIYKPFTLDEIEKVVQDLFPLK